MIFSNVRPLINLGGYASLGLVFAFLLTSTFYPALVILFPGKFTISKSISKASLDGVLTKLFNWVMGKKVSILIVSAIFAILGVYGTNMLVVNQRLLEDLDENSAPMQASRFFENVYSGTRQFEMQVKLKDASKTVLDKAVLADFERIENFLGEEYSATAMFSPVGIMKEANRVKHSGQSAYFVLPTTDLEYKKALDMVENYLEKGYPKVYVANNWAFFE